MAWIKVQPKKKKDNPPVEFTYTGGIQTYTVPASGKYKLEVWGGQGGNGGNGGYSIGYVNLTAGTVLNVIVGGQGNYSWCYYKDSANVPGGYNGGGGGCTSGDGWGWTKYYAGGGGGATHIAKAGDGYTVLQSYGNTETAANYVYIVAGGGGGIVSATSAIGGVGGGETGTGNNAGTQTSGYAFGVGQTVNTGGVDTNKRAGGGGGWYGGGYGEHVGSGGGSGWIGGVNDGETTQGVNTGNGKAIITPM